MWVLFYIIWMKKSVEIKENNGFKLWNYFKPYKFLIFCSVILLILDIVFTTISTILSADFLALVTEREFESALKKLITLAVIVSSAIVFNLLLSNIIEVLVSKISSAIKVALASRCFELSSKAFSDHNLGSFTLRILNDPNTIVSCVINIEWQIASFIQCLVIVIYISFLNLFIGLLTIAIVSSSFIFITLRKRLRERDMKVLNNIREKNNSLITESIKGERDVKSLYMENSIKEKFTLNYNEYNKKNIKSNCKRNSLNTMRNLFAQLFKCVSLLLGVIFVDRALLAMASFLFFYSNQGRSTNLANYLSYIIDNVTDIKISLKRIRELYENVDYELESFGTRHLKNVKGKIEFKNVEFSYTTYKEIPIEEQLKKEKFNKKYKIKERVATREIIGKNQVFKDLNFVIEPNTTVALVGKSGCGKTTIANLVAKIYSVDKGKVLIDGVNINSLDKDTIRRSIALVNQSPYIFDMTIKENLLLAKPNATDEEINNVIKESALDEFVSTLPEGLDTHVGEGGIKLSGGQKQRLAIARTMLKQSSIIIFDESTSSLDNFAQNTIKESIDNIKGKATVIIVAHRLTTIKNADKIFYLENGEIVDSGTFKELYKRNKTFKALFIAENI